MIRDHYKFVTGDLDMLNKYGNHNLERERATMEQFSEMYHLMLNAVNTQGDDGIGLVLADMEDFLIVSGAREEIMP